MKKTTAKDVAVATGHSVASVSRAFREGSPLAPRVRVEILRAAARLGYLPPAARFAGGLETISLVVGHLENPFYPAVITEFSQALQARGRRMVLHVVPPGGEVDTVLAQVLESRPDAAVVASALMSSQIARDCRARDMPVVLFNRVQPDLEMTAVTCDNYGGGRMAARHLLASGRKRIAMIAGRADTSTHLERARGFRDMMAEAGQSLLRMVAGEYSYPLAFAAMQDLLRGQPAPDAVFCSNDLMAIAAIDAARQLGASLPQDVAVVGFDDIAMAGWQSYGLTTIRQPVAQMVQNALDLIEVQLRDPGAGGAIRILPGQLIARQSG